jgi:4-amino-4-deoxy-L-arabinose transferase-like glycosyltransferase
MILPSAPYAEELRTRPRFTGQLTLVLLALSLLIGLASRLWMSSVMPLADTTEARYGEIVRVGLAHDFWLMPHASVNEPFFAKPPASTWLSMLAAKAFGMTEWALRLPYMLLMLAVAAISARLAMRESANRPFAGWWSASVVLLCPLGWVMAGAVMTDAVHLLAVVVAMAGATAVVSGDERARKAGRYVFWAALGAGALAKGLATIALALLPVAAYGVVTRRPFAVARKFISPAPILLAALIALPWYIAAERAYPGFLGYFIVGEHFQRFLVPGWQGDRYGSAHREVLGTIWLFAAVSIGPWLIALVAVLVRWFRSPAQAVAEAAPTDARWWACWILAPLLLFTFSRNIIWTYAATALPALGIWLAVSLARVPWHRTAAAITLLWAVALAFIAPYVARNVTEKSARTLLSQVPAIDPQYALPLVVPHGYRFSGAFYSQGRACVASNPAAEAACEAASGGKGLRIVELARARQMAATGTGEIIATDARSALLLMPPRSGSPQ